MSPAATLTVNSTKNGHNGATLTQNNPLFWIGTLSRLSHKACQVPSASASTLIQPSAMCCSRLKLYLTHQFVVAPLGQRFQQGCSCLMANIILIQAQPLQLLEMLTCCCQCNPSRRSNAVAFKSEAVQLRPVLTGCCHCFSTCSKHTHPLCQNTPLHLKLLTVIPHNFTYRSDAICE